MKHMRLALAVISTLCVSSILATEQERYPVIMWSEGAITTPKENTSPVQMTEVFDVLKATFEGAHA
jgi:hypothetical protein